jgi:tripartite-type tricarboxylate transporter receptor subunit TctC
MKRSALAALTAIGLVFAMGLVAPELRAQTFPSEPITLIVAWPAGGGSDISMRLLADALSKQIKVPVRCWRKTFGAPWFSRMATCPFSSGVR